MAEELGPLIFQHSDMPHYLLVNILKIIGKNPFLLCCKYHLKKIHQAVIVLLLLNFTIKLVRVNP